MSDLNLNDKLDLLSRYKLKALALIGVGGTSEIFLVENEEGERFALKRLLGQYRTKREWRDSILLEGVHLTMVQSNRVIKCMEVLRIPIPQALIKISIDTDPSSKPMSARQEIALLLEYIEGAHLRALYKRISQGSKAFTKDETASVIWDISRGLEALHTAIRGKEKPCPITHGDLSPTNIMIQRDGSALLIDLSSSTSDLTMESVIRRPGKQAYLSLKSQEGENEGVEGDLYALGCVWFELITGAVPSSTPHAHSWRSLQDSGWPSGWAKLVSGLLSPFPQNRTLAFEKLDRQSLWGKDKKAHAPRREAARQSLAQRVAEVDQLRSDS